MAPRGRVIVGCQEAVFRGQQSPVIANHCLAPSWGGHPGIAAGSPLLHCGW